MTYEDETVVLRSDLIVIGAIEDGTLQYVPHPSDGRGMSWEHRARLKITSVVKGNSEATEIPVTLDYGLEPYTGVRIDQGSTTHPIPTTGPVEVLDEADDPMPVIRDIRRDSLWLLRKHADGRYHVTDPEDIEPASRVDYLKCYLSADPESAVRAHLQQHPDVAVGATRYLAHLEVQRILKEPDPALRAERLTPYFVQGDWWDRKREAFDGLAACGTAAGPYLMGVYKSPRHEALRESVIDLWGATKYAGATDLLIEELGNGNRYFVAQKLEPGWWNDKPDESLNARRRAEYSVTYAAVRALGMIGAPAARDTIDETKRVWTKIGFENTQIVEACDESLKTLRNQAG